MHELALDKQKHEVEAVAQCAGREDCRVHVGHGEELLRLDPALPRPSVEPMNISATTTITSASDTPLRNPTKVCGSDSSNITSARTRMRDAPITLAANSRVLRAFMTPYATLNRMTSAAPNAAT